MQLCNLSPQLRDFGPQLRNFSTHIIIGTHTHLSITPTTKVMMNHFGRKHKDLKASNYSEECKVQMVFKGGLQKYVQIEEHDEMEMELEGNSEWKMALELEF